MRQLELGQCSNSNKKTKPIRTKVDETARIQFEFIQHSHHRDSTSDTWVL